MAFSAVSWAYRDVITSTKLQQMVDNLKAHDHRPDGTQGAAFRRNGSFSVGTIAAGANLQGTVTFSPAFKAGTVPQVFVSSGRTRLTPGITVVDNTGFTWTLENWTTGSSAATTGYWFAIGEPA